MRRIILLIVILLAICYIVVSFTQIQSILDTLSKGNLPFLLIAILFECLCLFNNSVTYASLYRLVGLKEERWQLFLMSTAMTFVNMVTPTAGVGGMAVFLDSARQRKLSTAKVLVVGILYALYEYTTLFFMVLLAFVVLLRRNDLNGGELTAAGILLLIMLIEGAVLYLGYRSSAHLGKILFTLAKWINHLMYRFFHRDLVAPENAFKFSGEIADGVKALQINPKKLVWPFLFSLNNKAILLCVLAFTFLALDTPYSIGTIVGGFSIGQLFYYVSPTPGGVGVVEGVYPIVLSSLRVPLSKALLITLSYRAVTLWFPLLIGFFSFRILLKKQGV
ncbi:MAG: lysylphosphatidylglycerol synthase transmembrane domain-containing protein [Chloroflexi bacterium]|nr:lysylphosphatidylglycerol synthase transmembrane domain-containing protein [Chloroflexota bacterium]